MGNSGYEATELADWLRQRLKDLDWMQKTLAEKSGLSTSSISDLINERQALTAETAEKIAAVSEMRVTATELLRKAGVLKQPPVPGNERRELALSMFDNLSGIGQDLVLDFMEMLQQRERGQNNEPARKKSKV